MTHPMRRIAASAALTLAALSVVACADDAHNPPPAAPTSSQPAAAGVTYEIVDDLCEFVDTGAILEVLPYVVEELAVVESVVPEAMNCAGVVGVSDDADAQGDLIMTFEVFDTAADAEENYTFLHENNIDLADPTDIDGIGQQGFQVVMAGLDALMVKVLDGNAVFTLIWYVLSIDEAPDGIFEALTETVRGTMLSLQNA